MQRFLGTSGILAAVAGALLIGPAQAATLVVDSRMYLYQAGGNNLPRKFCHTLGRGLSGCRTSGFASSSARLPECGEFHDPEPAPWTSLLDRRWLDGNRVGCVPTFNVPGAATRLFLGSFDLQAWTTQVR